MASSRAASEELIALESGLLAASFKNPQFPLSIARSEGRRVWDEDGNDYLDFTGAAAVALTGYHEPRLDRSLAEAISTHWFHVSPLATSKPVLALAQDLRGLLSLPFESRVWFGLSGSEAMDFLFKAIPLASGRQRAIAFIGGFAGTTTGSSMISGFPTHARAMNSPFVTKAPFPNGYRCPMGSSSDFESAQLCLNFLEDHLLTSVSPAEETGAIFVEAVQADNGAVRAHDYFLQGIRELCDRYGIWLVLDEVKVGLGRTGRMFAYEHANIEPDAVVLGKALGGGLPLSAVVGRSEILDLNMMINSTMGGHPAACATSSALLSIIAADSLVDRAATAGTRLLHSLKELEATHSVVGDCRGLGLEIGVELVIDHNDKTPAPDIARSVVKAAFEAGLIVTTAGVFGNVLELSPPLNVTGDEIEEAVGILDQSIAVATTTT